MRIPLIGSLNSRDGTNTALVGSSQKDQFFKDVTFQVVQNAASGKQTIYVMGRQQYADGPIPSGGSGAGTAIHVWAGNSGVVLTGVGNTNSTIWSDNSSIGTITGQSRFIDEAFLEGKAVALISSSDNTAWYYPSDAGTGSPTFTGDLNSNTSITNVAITTGLYAGQTVTHANIPANTYITQISGSTVTISAAATATAASQTITRTPIAKIYDADYPGNASMTPTGRFVALDGYAFKATTSGRIYQSDLSDSDSYQANNYITAQEFPDPLVALMRLKNYIVAFGSSSIEFMVNNGNATGSVLGRVQHLASKIGCINQFSVCYFKETIAFVGKSDGVNGVYLLNGAVPQKISDHAIDTLLMNSDISACRLNVLTSYGVPVLVLTLSASTANCHVYHSNIGMWHPWVLDDAIAQSDVQNQAGTTGAVYVGGSNSVYMAAQGSSIASGSVQFVYDNGRTNFPQPIWAFTLYGDRAVSALNIAASFSGDDGQNFSSARNIDVSKADATIKRCGSYKGRVTVKPTGLTGVSGRPHRLEAVEIE